MEISIDNSIDPFFRDIFLKGPIGLVFVLERQAIRLERSRCCCHLSSLPLRKGMIRCNGLGYLSTNCLCNIKPHKCCLLSKTEMIASPLWLMRLMLLLLLRTISYKHQTIRNIVLAPALQVMCNRCQVNWKYSQCSWVVKKKYGPRVKIMVYPY